MPDKPQSQTYPALRLSDRWRTIGGNRILIHESEGQPQEAQPSPSSQRCRANQSDWERDAEQARVSNYFGTAHQLGLIVFNETQSFSDRPDSNEPIDVARQKLAHSIINADDKWGAARQRRASTALPIEPSENALKNPAVRSAYESSMKAALEAYLSCDDPTHGAVYLNQRRSASRANRVSPGGDPKGVVLSTQSGPYDNSFPNEKVPSRVAWLNTFWDVDHR